MKHLTPRDCRHRQSFFSDKEAIVLEVEESVLNGDSLLPLSDTLQGRRIVDCLWLFEKAIKNERRKVRQGAQSLARLYCQPPFDAETIEEALAADLAESLLNMIARTFVLELNVARLEGALVGETPAQRFEYFLRRLRDQDTADRLLDEYPVLLEQVRIKLKLWADYSLEFLKNLCEDWKEILKTFYAGDPGLLKAAQLGAGDSHRRGRSVIILSFASGARLVYKPRSLAVDEHFSELLSWLNQHGADPPLLPVRSLDRGCHGWTEFIRREACTTEESVQRFYRRQGAYLAILYALEATDFHCQNLIAEGENPMLVDLEALFHPRFLEEDDGAAVHSLRTSVLKVGLLPTRFAGLKMSGLGGAGGQPVPEGAPQWENAETDEMCLVRKSMKMSGAENRPQYQGAETDALQYAGEIADGFEQTYRVLIGHRNELVATLRNFSDDEVRVVLRPTRVYASFLWESFHPDVLRDSLDRERLFDRLAGMDAPRAAEKADLLRGDVPLFSAKPVSRDLWTSDGERIENYFDESGMSLVSRRIESLSETDLHKQVWIIRASLVTLSSVAEGPRVRNARPKAERHVHPNEFLVKAIEIGDRLQELSSSGEELTWIGLMPDDTNSSQLAMLGADLYDGLPGVILFLAHLGALCGTARHTATAKAGLKTLRRFLNERSGMQMVGGFIGWGGLIYCFAQLAALWGDKELGDEAGRMAERAVEFAESDNYLDVTSGVAGLALTLRSLDQMEKPARVCGERLLSTLTRTREGAGWFQKQLSKQPLTGFAHGNAGVGYALLEIAAMTGESNFTTAARNAFDYERTLFSAEQGNWPDLRQSRTSDYMLAWCHGAPGIGLSRLGAWRHCQDELLRKEIDAALETTLRKGFGGNHSLCHGDFGNLDVLLVAATALGDHNWASHANRLAGAILDAAKETGWICGNALGVESPGLMTGIAGIGYELLRLAVPQRVPSVLALEKPGHR